MPTLLDGKQLAATMQAEIARDVAALAQAHGVRPGLAAVLVGDNPASQVYVRNKRKACAKTRLESWLHELPKPGGRDGLLGLVDPLNPPPRPPPLPAPPLPPPPPP